MLKSQAQLRKLSKHLQSIREDERKIIAQEIHDELGQALTALKLDLSFCNNQLPDTKETKKIKKGKFPAMLRLIDETIKDTRRISTKLRPSILDDLGLIPALEWQLQEFQKRTKINCEKKLSDKNINIEKNLSTAIFRIFQETLTNIVRHAKAKKVKVSLSKRKGELLLKVEDDGIGIGNKNINGRESLGLLGMKERAIAFGGELLINSSNGKGTIVNAKFPVN